MKKLVFLGRKCWVAVSILSTNSVAMTKNDRLKFIPDNSVKTLKEKKNQNIVKENQKFANMNIIQLV